MAPRDQIESNAYAMRPVICISLFAASISCLLIMGGRAADADDLDIQGWGSVADRLDAELTAGDFAPIVPVAAGAEGDEDQIGWGRAADLSDGGADTDEDDADVAHDGLGMELVPFVGPRPRRLAAGQACGQIARAASLHHWALQCQCELKPIDETLLLACAGPQQVHFESEAGAACEAIFSTLAGREQRRSGELYGSHGKCVLGESRNGHKSFFRCLESRVRCLGFVVSGPGRQVFRGSSTFLAARPAQKMWQNPL